MSGPAGAAGILRISVFALWCVSVGTGAAAEILPYPSAGMLQNTKASEALDVACEPPEGARMTCRFSRIRVTKKAETVAPPPVSQSECAGLDTIVLAWRDGVPLPGVDAEAFRDRFARQDPHQRADTEALLKAFGDFCARRDDASAKIVADIIQGKEARTCTLGIATCRLDFDWNPATAKWESVGKDTLDECGAVTTAAFERPAAGPGNRPWNYRVTNVVTNPAEKSLSGESCAEFDGRNDLYAAEQADIYVGCDYIRFAD